LSFDLLFTLYTFGEEKSAKTFSVKGVVLGGGKPQAGVSVYAALEISPSGKFADNLQTKRVSKSYGTYQFDDLPMPDDGRLVHYRLFASVDKRWIGWARLVGMPGEFVDLENLPIQLFPAKSITGIVKDEDGQPIEGATVRATAINWMFQQTHLPSALPFFPSTRTDANGNFVVHNIQAGGGATIRIEKEGYGRFTVYRHPALTPLDVTLYPAGAIEGRLIDSITGKTAKGILLECTGKRDRNFVTQAATGADGNYRFDGLPADKYNISLAEQLSDRTAAMVKDVSVESGKTAQRVDVKLVEGGVISGKIATKSGKPMPNMEVYFVDASSIFRCIRTDEKGEYRFRAMTGEARILSPPENSIPARTHPGNQFNITEGKEIEKVDYIYVGISIKGEVFTSDGNPVADALIYRGRIALVKSKADGTFELPEDLPEGSELTLSAEKTSEGLRGVVTITVAPDIPVKITVAEKALNSNREIENRE